MGQTFVYIAWWGLTRMPVLLEKPFRKKNYQRGRRNKLLQKICNAETALKFLEYSFPRKAFNLYLFSPQSVQPILIFPAKRSTYTY